MTTGQLLWAGAWKTVATLFGGLVVGILIGNLVFAILPGSSVTNPHVGYALIAAIPTLISLAIGAAAWGRAMARMAGAPGIEAHGMGRRTWIRARHAAGGVFATRTRANRRRAIRRPRPDSSRVHAPLRAERFIISGFSAFAIGLGLGDARLARSLAWRVGLTGAASFLAVNLIMEAAGWVVGAPDAGERATMITVMSLGNLAAALTGGGMLGVLLGRSTRARTAVTGTGTSASLGVSSGS
jgi:hypothetical protein